MLSAMSACAYRLGMAFGREAEGAADLEGRLQLFQLFDRCFFSVRVATALQLRLGRGPVAAREAIFKDPREREAPAPLDRPDHDRARERFDGDREREAEPASLPILIETLERVAAEASALPGPRPSELAAELPVLRELLAPAVRPASLRPPAGALRARLAGSATPAVAMLSRPAPTSGPRFPRRPATGPPRR